MQFGGFISFLPSFTKNVSCTYCMSGMVLGGVVTGDTVTAHKDFYGVVKKVNKKHNNYNIVLKRL